jgi:hypothetical protein
METNETNETLFFVLLNQIFKLAKLGPISQKLKKCGIMPHSWGSTLSPARSEPIVYQEVLRNRNEHHQERLLSHSIYEIWKRDNDTSFWLGSEKETPSLSTERSSETQPARGLINRELCAHINKQLMQAVIQLVSGEETSDVRCQGFYDAIALCSLGLGYRHARHQG